MNWKISVAVIVCLLLAVTAGYVFTGSLKSGQAELTIYTYESLFTYAPNVTAVNQTVFGAFEHQYNVKIKVVRFDGTQDMLAQLAQQKSNPQADLVIGLTNVEAQKAVSEGILQNYTPPNLKYVPAYLVKDLQPQHYLVPYEFSPITVDYCNISGGVGSNMSFQTLQQPSYAEHLVLENPLTDSTGLSFLLYEITFYSYVAHENWQQWWVNTEKYSKIVPSWDYAFSVFPNSGYDFAVSYGTDPAYFATFGGYRGCGTSALHYSGNSYVWLEIEGMGIVAGASHVKLAEEFENWFLGQTVQSVIPTSEWMFPANSDIQLPSVYRYAVGTNDSIILNNYLTPSQLASNLSNWLSEWQTLSG
ncbi:MAG: thiamine ABC transporter substrate-binding protein [Thermoprotei archaeon]